MTPLASKIHDEIEIYGAISFARFMDLALYAPELGYYEQQREIGQHGDFFTSVSVGSLFGELLAYQFAEWIDGKSSLQIVEAGAHGGQLAADILNWFRAFRPETFGRLEYFILEPSLRRREWQKKTLARFSEKTFWASDWKSLGRSPGFTVCFSNELFDAMPVHRFGWDAKMKMWFEWGVACEKNKLVWTRLSESQRSPVPPPQVSPELLDVLPDEFSTETCPAAVAWWNEAASCLHSGKLVAIDYGLRAEEFFSPHRSNGTLRAFFQHHANADLLARPGEQDITTHVNFSSLKKTGESAGLKTEALVSQAKFLTEIAAKAMSHPESFGPWDARQTRRLQTLTHPEHLGRPFRVLVQSRG